MSLGLEVLGQLLLVTHGNPVGSAITTIAGMPQRETRAPEQDGLPTSRRQAFLNLVSTQLWHEFLNVPTNRGQGQPAGGHGRGGSTCTTGWKHNPVDHCWTKGSVPLSIFRDLFSVQLPEPCCLDCTRLRPFYPSVYQHGTADMKI